MTTSRIWSSATTALALAAAPAAQCPVAIDFTPGSGFTRPAFYHNAWGQELYFNLDAAGAGSELWKWSPATGMVLVADVKPGGGSSSPQQMTACCTAQGPRIFFSAAGTTNDHELWATDGTPGSFYQVKEINPSSYALPANFEVFGNRVMFSARDSVPLALPNDPALEGGALHLQMMWYDAAAVPVIQLSNGLLLVLGEAAPH